MKGLLVDSNIILDLFLDDPKWLIGRNQHRQTRRFAPVHPAAAAGGSAGGELAAYLG